MTLLNVVISSEFGQEHLAGKVLDICQATALAASHHLSSRCIDIIMKRPMYCNCSITKLYISIMNDSSTLPKLSISIVCLRSLLSRDSSTLKGFGKLTFIFC